MIIRNARSDDVAELCELLNEIIIVGGTTAFQAPLSNDQFTGYFLPDGADNLSCLLAESADGELNGFQYLGRNKKLPDDCADIATFSRINSTARGTGTALFVETVEYAKTAGITIINATIRADNVPGLAYYQKMGFVDASVEEAVPLIDGTPIDRISKRYSLK